MSTDLTSWLTSWLKRLNDARQLLTEFAAYSVASLALYSVASLALHTTLAKDHRSSCTLALIQFALPIAHLVQ